MATILDLFPWSVVGWSMSANMTADLAIDALQVVILRRGIPKKLLHSSNQGRQYTGECFSV